MAVEPQFIIPGILLLLAFTAAVLQVGRWIGGVNADRDAFKGVVDAIHTDVARMRDELAGFRAELAGFRVELDGFRAELAAFRAELEGFRVELRDIRSRIEGIDGRLRAVELRFPGPPVTSDSPLRLTEIGQRMSDYMEGAAWAAGRAPSLVSEVEGFEPFEIDQFCEAYLRERLDEDDRKIVGRCAYQFGYDQPAVLSVLRVLLRDELLSATGATTEAASEQPAS